jgi:hypothetical protein
MVYLKSILFGLGGAVLAAVLWITATLFLPIFLPYAISRIRGTVSKAFGGGRSVLSSCRSGTVSSVVVCGVCVGAAP